ncbi:MAG: hypothetical protein GDA39_05315 [Hyphomonadaceae bacterium]|nr:hypothetical protein [Hyphomonadaceae bacterium]
MPTHVKCANSARSKVRALVEHSFAYQKHRAGEEGQDHWSDPRHNQNHHGQHCL